MNNGHYYPLKEQNNSRTQIQKNSDFRQSTYEVVSAEKAYMTNHSISLLKDTGDAKRPHLAEENKRNGSYTLGS